MSVDQANQIIEQVIEVEGGYVDNPDDKGGATNLGITQATLSQFLGRAVHKDEVRELDMATAVKIYKQDYWDRYKADQFPDQLKYVYFDQVVNHGPRNAGRITQKSCVNRRTLEFDEIDGIVGPGTLAACADLSMDSMLAERAVFFSNLVLAECKYLVRTNQDQFLEGWMRHRVFEPIRRDERAKVLAEIEEEKKQQAEES